MTQLPSKDRETEKMLRCFTLHVMTFLIDKEITWKLLLFLRNRVYISEFNGLWITYPFIC